MTITVGGKTTTKVREAEERSSEGRNSRMSKEVDECFQDVVRNKKS